MDQVHVDQAFSIRAEAVFDAWLNPPIMRRWLFAGPATEILQVDVDPHPILSRLKGVEIKHFGEYQEISPPRRLVFTLAVPWHFPSVTCVLVEIQSTPGGCTLTLTQKGVEPEKTEGNGRGTLANLAAILG
jgi:uncharacterized protein YndB with AHSA1/START domain